MTKYKVVFTSKTGNTEKLAKTVYDALPGNAKDIERLSETTGVNDAGVYFIGFWVDHGSCSLDMMEYLEELDEKQIVLFGTCGCHVDDAYYKQIEMNVQAFVPDGNEYLGMFLCQGKMPMDIRRKYEEMRTKAEYREEAERLISNFDEALLHPDQQDMRNARQFVDDIIEKRLN